MTDTKITPDALERAARALATELNGGDWSTDYTENQKGVWIDRVRAAMTPDLATAYLAQADEIERLKKRVEAADRLADAAVPYTSPVVNADFAAQVCRYKALVEAIAAYRATEGRG